MRWYLWMREDQNSLLILLITWLWKTWEATAKLHNFYKKFSLHWVWTMPFLTFFGVKKVTCHYVRLNGSIALERPWLLEKGVMASITPGVGITAEMEVKMEQRDGWLVLGTKEEQVRWPTWVDQELWHFQHKQSYSCVISHSWACQDGWSPAGGTGGPTTSILGSS